jgi:NhaP-type Na+/H+ or K+/H+ antiporter
MDTLTFTVIAVGVVLYSLVSRRLETSPLTGPMVFTAFGLVIGPFLGITDLDFDHGAIHTLAEVTLVLVLFTDAARIDLRKVRRDHNLPVRMLLIGMPLIIVAGTAAGLLLPLGLGLWEAALLAAILAPSDAALSQSVVNSPRVPQRIRQALNIESGLNDGLALPLVFLFFSLAAMTTGISDDRNWIVFVGMQIILGPLAGGVIGWGFALLIERAVNARWMGESFQGPAILGVALLAFTGAEMVGGNGFIAAFVAGAIFGNRLRDHCTFLFRFAEAEGHLLVLLTFLVFGGALLPEAFGHVGWALIAYVVLSLTVVRMAPIALSLTGSGLERSSTLFLGWFGPRGLASILFAMFILDGSSLASAQTILIIVMVTSAVSILAHGLSSAPAAKWYGNRIVEMKNTEEARPVTTMPTRTGRMFPAPDTTSV